MAQSWSPAIQEALRTTARARYGIRPFVLPVSSPYGPRVNPVTKTAKYHHGVDLPLPRGTPVRSIWPGRVKRVDLDGVGPGLYNGNAIWVETPPGWLVAYLHLAVPPALKPGAAVSTGQVIGLAGSTGRSTGPHLHLQIYANGKTVDPLVLFPLWQRV